MKKITALFRYFEKKPKHIILISMIFIAGMFYINDYAKKYYVQNNKIQKNFNIIKNNELLLNYNVLVTSLYMYSNNDKLIESIDRLNRSIDALLRNGYFREKYGVTYKMILQYKKEIDKKVKEVYQFQTLNSSLKNSTMYLASLMNRLPEISMYKLNNRYSKDVLKHNVVYAQKVIQVVSNIFLAKSSFDMDFIKNLDLSFFENFKAKDKEIENFNHIFLAHLKVYKEYFPKLVVTLKKITDKKTLDLLDRAYSRYFDDMNADLKYIKFISYGIIFLISLATLLIMFLLYNLNKRNELLHRTNKELELSYITDKLTGLYNRNKFDKDVNVYYKPVLILLNIDRFKHINDYYGSKIGDAVLKKTAKIIQNNLPDIQADVYRLGADDFGIMYEKNMHPNPSGIARKIINYFEKNEIEIENIRLNISLSAGISEIHPLLETADIALKYVKKSHRHKIKVYEENMNEEKEIKLNIQKTNILYRAIKENRIVPYFQPIVDTFTKEIHKYEVLARIVHEDGKVESIFPYLQIAKENKLYRDVTKIILNKTYEKISKNNINFSINISVEDIFDMQIMKQMYHLYIKNKSLSKRVTFEILESEAVSDYQKISAFLRRVKYFGASIAIDDFGSGYSNFEHLINMKADYIKIDGSLIRQLETNNTAYKVVEVITDFARAMNIKTVAEYVENEKIYEKVKKLGINYSQGYYFYRPSPECKT